MTNCKSLQELRRFLEGLLTREQERETTYHLTYCNSCLEEINQMIKTKYALDCGGPEPRLAG